jgi:hypothetical protein
MEAARAAEREALRHPPIVPPAEPAVASEPAAEGTPETDRPVNAP